MVKKLLFLINSGLQKSGKRILIIDHLSPSAINQKNVSSFPESEVIDELFHRDEGTFFMCEIFRFLVVISFQNDTLSNI